MSASICIIIDKSGSMLADDSLHAALAGAASFAASVMRIGDSVGVVAFNGDAQAVFPLQPITSTSDKTRVVDAIMGIIGGGLTNMKAAFDMANAMMPTPTDSANQKLGEVFLSDGMYNVGGDPVPGLGARPPVYTIALGAHKQEATLHAIADKTGGGYFFAADPGSLGAIYNAIVGQARLAALVATPNLVVSSSQSLPASGTIPSGATEAILTLEWIDPAVRYGQLSATVVGPDGTKQWNGPEITGAGFAVFRIPDPAPGTYTITPKYAGSGTLRCTVGIFDDNDTLALHVAPPRGVISAGAPMEAEVRLTDGGEPLDDVRLSVRLESPLVTLDEALATHAARLDKVEIGDDVAEEHEPLARLRRLQQTTGEDLMPRTERPGDVSAADDGVYRIRVPDVGKAGSHTLHVTAHGTSRISNTPYQRSAQVSFVVK